MARLTRKSYRHAGEWNGAAQMMRLYPIARYDVAPGETVQGKFNVKVMTDTVTSPIMNSVVFDIWAFYVPHRIVWDEWVQFISDAPGAPTSVPLVGQSLGSPEFFETGAQVHSSMFRRAYAKVWNEFFRHQDQTEVAEDGSIRFPLQINLLPMYQTAMTQTPLNEDTFMAIESDDTLNVTQLRREMVEDRRTQRKVMYGTKYTDFLREMGVKVSSALLEEPEFLGKSRIRISFVETQATNAGDQQGTQVSNGYGKATLTMPKMMFPEHGNLMVLAAMRPQSVSEIIKGPPTPSNRSQFFRIDQADDPAETIDAGYFDPSLPPVTGDPSYQPRYEGYRRPGNWSNGAGWFFSHTPAGTTAQQQRDLPPTALNSYFENSIGTNLQGEQLHWTFNNFANLERISPVVPRQV